MSPSLPKFPRHDLNLAVIGNCSFSSLIDRRGRHVWCCLPRFDSDPLFCDLLQPAPDGRAEGAGGREIGFFDVVLEDFKNSRQSYLPNTAVVSTVLTDEAGAEVELIDFAPRFKNLDRTFRPAQLVRLIRPLKGEPRIRIRLRPAHGYGAGGAELTRGSNHVRYVMPQTTLRLTTDAPISLLVDETPFILDQPLTLFFGPDEPMTSPVAATGRDFFERTAEYWREWVRYLALPFEWQDAVIRAAITLKLSSYEETGAIIAAMTTSIPEAADTERTWDYRFCWIRDAYFVVQALSRLGATRTLEGFTRFVTNIIAQVDGGPLQPVYGIAHEAELTERMIPTMKGYRGMGPVRVGNQAHEHIQNDVYGSAVLAVTHVYFDQRLRHPGTNTLFKRLEQMGHQAVANFDKPDAGLWEFRGRESIHTFSSAMCWAACDRLSRIAGRLGLNERAGYWRSEAERMRSTILKEAFNEKLGCFASSFGGDEMDASLLMLIDLGLLTPEDPRTVATVDQVGRALKRGDHLFRYARPDDFGMPETAFNICTFWYIEALANIGRAEEARDMFENLLTCRNHVGLLSEDTEPATGELWGNFPQTYSLVGLINSAMHLSRSWRDAF